MKQNNANKMLASFFLVILIMSAVMPTAFAMVPPEQPGITIVVSFPPDDMTISLRFSDGSMGNADQLQRERKAWESYYHFFYWTSAPENPPFEGTTLVVQSEAFTFECPLPVSEYSVYNNLLTLNLSDESIVVGKPLARTIFLVSMRVILALIIEGMIFFVFGYRRKSSWITFMAVNLATQVALNVLFIGPNLGSLWIVGFVVLETIIFILEIIVFALILKEQQKGLAVVFTLTANFTSLLLGSILLAHLPT